MEEDESAFVYDIAGYMRRFSRINRDGVNYLSPGSANSLGRPTREYVWNRQTSPNKCSPRTQKEINEIDHETTGATS